MVSKKTTQKPSKSPDLQEFQIAGSDVRIDRTPDREQIWIDGKPVKYYKTKAGYTLNTNLFVDAQETLLEAAKLFLQRRAK